MARGTKRKAVESDIDDEDDDEPEHTDHQLLSEEEEGEEEDDDDGDDEEDEEDFEIVPNHNPVPDLPTQIVTEIISRLPIRSVFICRRVCKLWLSLISDPAFAKLHLSRSQVSLLVKPINRKSKPKPRQPQLQLVDLKIAPYVSDHIASMKLTPRTNLPGEPKVAFNVLNSCNGLLCLYEPKTKDQKHRCALVQYRRGAERDSNGDGGGLGLFGSEMEMEVGRWVWRWR